MALRTYSMGNFGSQDIDDDDNPAEPWYIDILTGEQLDPEQGGIPLFPTAFTTNGTVRVDRAPTDLTDIVRLDDVRGFLDALGNIHVEQGAKIILDGEDGDSYLTYNTALSRVELWVNGVLEFTAP